MPRLMMASSHELGGETMIWTGQRPKGQPEAHYSDAHCAPFIVDDSCSVCGVMHGDPCRSCGGRGFHKDECFIRREEESLGRLLFAVDQIVAQHEEGAFWDRGFDAGEWSGPAHAREQERRLHDLAAVNGFACCRDLLALIERRTGARWVHFKRPQYEQLADCTLGRCAEPVAPAAVPGINRLVQAAIKAARRGRHSDDCDPATWSDACENSGDPCCECDPCAPCTGRSPAVR